MWITLDKKKNGKELRIRVKREDVEEMMNSLTVEQIKISSECSLCVKYNPEGTVGDGNCGSCPLNVIVKDWSNKLICEASAFGLKIIDCRADVADYNEHVFCNKRTYAKALRGLRNIRRKLSRALDSPNRHRKYN